uniref:Uncharacterized protein n=1 Tax=Anguilla anguilla TaxID=7936 RepID=A0A0E9UGC5_ANGAN
MVGQKTKSGALPNRTGDGSRLTPSVGKITPCSAYLFHSLLLLWFPPFAQYD